MRPRSSCHCLFHSTAQSFTMPVSSCMPTSLPLSPPPLPSSLFLSLPPSLPLSSPSSLPLFINPFNLILLIPSLSSLLALYFPPPSFESFPIPTHSFPSHPSTFFPNFFPPSFSQRLPASLSPSLTPTLPAYTLSLLPPCLIACLTHVSPPSEVLARHPGSLPCWCGVQGLHAPPAVARQP